MFGRRKKVEPVTPDWYELASWQESFAHFDAVWAARFETLSARLVVIEAYLGNPQAGPEVERV